MLSARFENRPTLGGHRPGPTLAVNARPEVLDVLAKGLHQIPSLSRMRGVLVLGSATDVSVDARLDLSEASEAVWRVLAAATQLGMIAGRGVPRRYLDAPMPLAFPLAPAERYH